jgi:long-chain acyl-CoA synthetase
MGSAVQPGTGIERHALATPTRTAIVDGALSFTYEQLNAAGSRIAAGLRRLGVGADDVVVTKLHTRWEWFAVNLALAKLQAHQVSASWSLMDDELAYVIGDVRPRAFIHDSPTASTTVGEVEQVLLDAADGSLPDVRGWLDSREFPECWSPHPATLIIFTAGTSGRPKGAIVEFSRFHAPPERVQQYLQDQRRTLPSGPWMKSLLCRPLHHLAGPVQGRGCFDAGGELHVLRRFDAREVLRLVCSHGITHLSMVPTMAQRILDLPSEVRAQYDVSTVRMLHLGGAPVSAELKLRAAEFFGPHSIYEGYGSTELRYVTVMTPADQTRKPGSCGRIYDGVEVRIVDEQGQGVPAGVHGEILVRTPMRFSGYLNRPVIEELDAEGFFHTGDVGFLDDDGFMYLSGRKKDMIIRGGVNVYPAEIEAVLMRHPAIADAAVVGVPHRDLGEVPRAFCELRAGISTSSDEVIAFLSGKLAPYKVPAAVEFVTELPRNAMGKVLKRELRASLLASQ